jgi:hypothetical protein
MDQASMDKNVPLASFCSFLEVEKSKWNGERERESLKCKQFLSYDRIQREVFYGVQYDVYYRLKKDSYVVKKTYM